MALYVDGGASSGQAGSSNQASSEKDMQNSSFTEESRPEHIGTIEESYHKITKLMYGQTGLINFLKRLFYGVSGEDRTQFNYYFAVKRQLQYLDSYSFQDEF